MLSLTSYLEWCCLGRCCQALPVSKGVHKRSDSSSLKNTCHWLFTYDGRHSKSLLCLPGLQIMLKTMWSGCQQSQYAFCTCWKHEGFSSMAPHTYLRTQMYHTGTQTASVIHQTIKSQRLKVLMDSCKGTNWGNTCHPWTCSLGNVKLHFWPAPNAYIAEASDFHRSSESIHQHNHNRSELISTLEDSMRVQNDLHKPGK